MRAADHLPEHHNAAAWFLARHVREGRGERTAIVTDEGSITYAELDVRVRRQAAAFRDAGVGTGDRVAILLPDGPDWVACFWGALAAGAVAVPLSTLVEAEALRHILGDCAPRLVVADPAGLPGEEDIRPVLEAGCGAFPGPAWTAREARLRAEGVDPVDSCAPTHRDAFAFMLYTSGTTGRPKGVVHLHHDPWVCARTYGRRVLGIEPDDRCFSVAKLFFAYGLGNAGYFPMDVGAASVLYAGRPTPEAIFEQVRRHRPTLFFGVPTSYAQMLAAMEDGADPDFSSVRRCVSAGEALPAAVFERWRERTGLEILDGIGSTEICHIFLSGRPDDPAPGTTGLPVPGYDLRLVDETGTEVPDGEIGDLLVRGDSTMALYWNRHEETKRTLRGEWIRTGDKYVRDEAGHFRHAGRSDDMLKVGGIWVSPVEVEDVLLRHEAVLECAVVGEEDADGLVKPRAFVVTRREVAEAEREALAGALMAHVKERLEPYKYPRRVTFVDALPRTATGKVRRFLLR